MSETFTIDPTQPRHGVPALTYHAVMEAIEQTLVAVDAQRSIPRAAQVIDYAAILDSAVGKAQEAVANG